MKNGNELNSIIIGIGRIAFMMGQLVFFIGVVACWLGVGVLFSIYLMIVGIGIVIVFGQKVESIYIVKVIRRYRGRKRKDPPNQETG